MKPISQRLTLPIQSGCYLFYDKQKRLLYIGKAKNLRRRVASYFVKKSLDDKTLQLVKQIKSFDFIVTKNEIEALLLEARLICQHQPPYNIDLKDGKRYAYLKITDEEYPRLQITRQLTADGKYFGPFTSAWALRQIMLTTSQLFGLRIGRLTSTGSRELYKLLQKSHQQALKKISVGAYADNVKMAELFLKGKKTELIKVFQAKMAQASQRQNYELAKLYRDQLQAIEQISRKQLVDLPKNYDQDVIGFVTVAEEIIVQVFHIERGLLTSRQRYVLDRVLAQRPAVVMADFLRQYYLARPLPKEILLPSHLDQEKLLGRYLSQLKDQKVKIVVPQQGEKKKLIDLVLQNISAEFQNDPLKQLQATLGLSTLPRRIDGFDISNTSGQQAIGAVVRFRAGRSDKKFYRYFKIKTVVGPNDFAMMTETVYRRYKDKKSELPDLVLIDGGAGQLTASLKAFAKLGYKPPAILALAKKREEIYLPRRSRPVILAEGLAARRLLQKVRDEAHRFGLKHHRLWRQKHRRPA